MHSCEANVINLTLVEFPQPYFPGSKPMSLT
uniref:Uncharacterized protein n=1 Tax=Anguilla anguilla TaxID=7936 RepID=A0A0E9RK46_ANGAN